ncbi:hypothetical protein VNO78_15076 [Psophocarpus tetragonolobus]|uniref:AAA+ ATPase domain-containing protein n=1 Tax=Psophocarpus tetragonolobus TaxID=3891 RepID=A0AAN9XJA6_PSOTE
MIAYTVFDPTHKLRGFLSPYLQITFPEFSGGRLKRSELFTAIQSCLIETSSQRARKLRPPTTFTTSFCFPWISDEKRFYTLSFHKRHRGLISSSYILHVLEQGKLIKLKNWKLKLYTNNCYTGWGGYSKARWSHVVFEQPARFETLAMEQKTKEEMIDDLVTFKNGKEYYNKIGKAWNRGYLLYGPPGTGKSTMIAAMANFMHYHVYDLELTARVVKKEKDKSEDEKDPVKKAEEEENKDSKVTLSGLLNCIDGIWSGCAGERIIIFTTNCVDKLDPALIRSGRMDKKIESSYCCYEAFKVLKKNYLDVRCHHLFPIVEGLLKETKMTPADVSENMNA